MEVKEILSRVTVDCKDNGHNFTVTNRLHVIEELLQNTGYQLIHNGRLCRIYGKKPVRNQPVTLISSHVDCVYDRLFCEEAEDGIMKGTFDNSLTNACVLYDMIQGNLNENVVVAFTGDEEEESGGAYEVMRVMRQWGVQITLAIVLDITEEGWKEQYHFTVENDLGIDIMTAHRIVSLLEKYESLYGYTHDAEPDESYDYDEEDIACFTLCIPTYGDMHGEEGVLARANLLPTYCTVLAELANMDIIIQQ